ncbi:MULTISPECIES: hypothetical protein [Caproicibacterium]|uniref:Polya polymerase n=1 Tax=Caproicibacterium lactatifermentans TaxID=2666138 RepID=A0A859DNC8_9FIRM|nr:hypothetical protein [Caproicibacterium lactatifermentans]ARP51033.1 hypothetical protein B6259_09210 [Ruminococcaceae bacterium CPB6]MDD4807403.1 hypothetical protein [Oscillospiraceae bacterium]QKN23240.1 hypothetical protein GJQ69_01295 [Caproicibacterium lactatifermentans]QKO30078.1 hypothetical protein GKP14_03055 [Caproicibacterium lactatifermentans]
MSGSLLELHDVDVPNFLSLLEKCKGNVYLVSDEGDKLNLKSKLCQLVGLTRLIEGGKIASCYISCDNPDDESMLFRFNLYGSAAVKTEK